MTTKSSAFRSTKMASRKSAKFDTRYSGTATIAAADQCRRLSILIAHSVIVGDRNTAPSRGMRNAAGGSNKLFHECLLSSRIRAFAYSIRLFHLRTLYNHHTLIRQAVSEPSLCSISFGQKKISLG